MFFNYNILIKRGGRFFLVWRLVHQPRAAVAREEVDKLNIPGLCDAVISHIPETAGYAELPYSLYLQAQLMHGIALVFAQQVGFFLKDVEEAANALKPVITKVPKKFEKRKIAAGESQQTDFDDLFTPPAKRKRTVKEHHPFEDFTVTRPIAVARVEDITLQEPPLMQPFNMYDVDDDLGFLNKEDQRTFQELLANGDFDVHHPEPEAERKRSSKRVTFGGLSPLRPETPVEHARMSGDARSSGGRLTDHGDDRFQLEHSDNAWPAPPSPTAAPGENLDVSDLQGTPRQRPLQDEEEVQIDVVEQEQPSEPYSLHLEPLGPMELELAGRKKPRSRRARAIRDNKMQFTQAELEDWQADYGSTCHPVVLVKPLQVPLETLFNPRPHMIKGLSEALMPLYEKVLIPVCELPMDPETKFTFDFYANHVRRLPIDLEEAVALAQEQDESRYPPVVEVYLVGSLADPNFVPDAVVPQPDNVYEAPDMPWDTEKEYLRRGYNDTDSGFVTVEMTPLGTTAGGRRLTFESLLSEHRRKTVLTEIYTLSPFGHKDAHSCRGSVLESPRVSRCSMLGTPPTEQHAFVDPFDVPYYGEIEQPRDNHSNEHDDETIALNNFSLRVEPSGPELTAKSRFSGKSPSPPPDAKILLEKIKSCGAAAVVFSELLPNNTKRAAARTFYSLLELLKHNQVKAAQQSAFGEILVRTVSTE